MRKPFLLTLGLLIVTSLLAIHVSVGSSAPHADLEEVDNYIHAEMDELNIPGLEAVIVHKDQIVYARGFGVADASGRALTAQTPMMLGSVSKGFTALAVMQLVEAGHHDLPAGVELGDAIRRRVADVVTKDRRTLVVRCTLHQQALKSVPVEDIVSEHQRTGVAVDEALADQERLCEPIWAWLHGVLEAKAPARAVTQERPKQVLLVWRRDD